MHEAQKPYNPKPLSLNPKTLKTLNDPPWVLRRGCSLKDPQPSKPEVQGAGQTLWSSVDLPV